jgi:hypothetical protein
VTATIAYDRPVKNLIDALTRTGHVTLRTDKKTSVTIHHNAGRLSHEGCLNVWKVRPASAHFDVDSSGAVCQYVKVNGYAWAAGNGFGNRSSIHIEMANASTGGQWPVAEVTWLAAARLAGWLHARVIGARPSKASLFYHSHWRATACAGPYMDSVYGRVLAAAQKAYDYFTKAPAKPTSTPAKHPTPAPAAQKEPAVVIVKVENTEPEYVSDGISRRWLQNGAQRDALVKAIRAEGGKGVVTSVKVAELDGFGPLVGPVPA